MTKAFKNSGSLLLCCCAALIPSAALAQGQFGCERVDVPISVRAEGMAELVSDVLLRCTGGTPVTRGNALPRFQIVVTATAPFTSRVLVPGASGTGMSEALVIVDEPGFTDQVGCLASAGGEACPATAGAESRPNVFQGRQIQANSISFSGVPIDPPGSQGVRTLRISNLRVNSAALLTQSPPTTAVRVAVQLFDQNGAVVPVRGTPPASAESKPGAVVSVRTVADTPPALKGTPGITVPPAALPVGAPQNLVGFNLKFTEGFPGAFRRRNTGTNSDSPFFMTVQATPGLVYNTESGFLNTLLPGAMKMDTAGLADTGTRLLARFQNVPRDVLIWVSTRDVKAGTTQYSEASARAILTAADGNGLGPLTPIRPSINGLAQIPVVNGTATAVWEIVSANPATMQEVSFAVAISAQTANPGQGTAVVTAGLAPFEVKDGSNDARPLFRNAVLPVPAFAVSNLLTVPALNSVSAASYAGPLAAPGSIVAAFGSNLAGTTAFPNEDALPTSIAGTSVELIDTAGARTTPPLFFVSPSQVNFVVSPELQPGPILVNILSGTRLIASGYLQLDSVAPALFSASGNGSGVLAGEALIGSGSRFATIPVATYEASEGRWLPNPISVGAANEFAFLALYGTGIRGRAALTDVRASVGGLPVPVTYAGMQGSYPGLDQVNVGPLPRELAGKGLVDVVVRIGRHTSNTVQVELQ